MSNRKLNVKPLAIKCKEIKDIEKGYSNKNACLKYGVPSQPGCKLKRNICKA